MSSINQKKTDSGSLANPSSGSVSISVDDWGQLFTKDSLGNITVYSTGSGGGGGGGTIDTSSMGTTKILGQLTVLGPISSSMNLFGDRIFANSYVSTPALESSTGFINFQLSKLSNIEAISGSLFISGTLETRKENGIRELGIKTIIDDSLVDILPAYDFTGSLMGTYLMSGSDKPNMFSGILEVPPVAGYIGAGTVMNSGSKFYFNGMQNVATSEFAALSYLPNFLGSNEQYQIRTGDDNGVNEIKLSKKTLTSQNVELYIDNETGGWVITNEIPTTSSLAIYASGSNLVMDVTDEGTKTHRPITQISTDFTASTSVAGGGDTYVRVSGDNTCSLQPNSIVPVPVGMEWTFFQVDSGQRHFEPSVGVTLNSKGGNTKLTGQYSYAVLKKINTDEWDLYGDLS